MKRCLFGAFLIGVLGYIALQVYSSKPDPLRPDHDRNSGYRSDSDLISETHFESIPESAVEMSNVDCYIGQGLGDSSEMGVLLFGDDSNTSVHVLNSRGAIQGGQVLYNPNHVQLAKRDDESVVVIVGNIRRNAKIGRPSDSDEPVTVFHGNDVIYESDKVLDFGLKGDGSSFFVVEPTAGGSSRLVWRDIDNGTESQHDLDHDWAAPGDESGYIAEFGKTDDSLMILPTDNASLEPRRFLSGQDGNMTTISFPSSIKLVASVFESASVGYFVQPVGESIFEVSRRDFRENLVDSESTGWTRRISLQKFYGTVSLSDDAKWLVLSAWDTIVLDAQTGTTVFRWPIAGNKEEERERLASVIKSKEQNGVDQQPIGAVMGVSIQGGRLLMTRKLGMEAFATCHNTADPQACIETAQSKVSEVVDVFEMESIEVDGSPDFRIPKGNRFGCETIGDSFGELRSENGYVVFRQRKHNIESPEADD